MNTVSFNFHDCYIILFSRQAYVVGIIPNVQRRKLGFREAKYYSVRRYWREKLRLHLPDFKVLTLAMIPYCFSGE